VSEEFQGSFPLPLRRGWSKEMERSHPMKNMAAVSIALALLIGSSAMADISQAFDFNVGTGGTLIWNTGVGGADLSLGVGVTNLQCSTGVLSSAGQGLLGTFAATASGGGEGVALRGTSEITGLGLDGGAAFGFPGFAGQVQSIGSNVDPLGQTEGTTLGSEQNLQRAAGPGGAEAANTPVLLLGQIASNNLGKAIEWNTIIGSQETGVGGGSTGIGTTTTDVVTGAAQIQAIQ
jgi:hypothetical protein